MTPPLPAETVPGTAEWRRARAREIVRDHTLLAAGADLIPLPILDSLAVAAVQLSMLDKLSRLYGRDYDENLARNLLAATSIGFVHHVVTSHRGGWKLLFAGAPVIGRALTALAWPAIFAIFTRLLGEACTRHFEAGGNFSDFTAQDLAKTPFGPLAVHFINREQIQ